MFQSHTDAKPFRFKVIPDWDDIVDLCAKDRATGSGAETALDADDAMSEEVAIEKANEATNDSVDASWSSTQGLEEASYNMKKRGQSTTSPTMKSQKRKVGEKDGIVSTMREIGGFLKDFLQSTKKKTVNVKEVIDEVNGIPGLNRQQIHKAINWLSENMVQFEVIRSLPHDQKKYYILSFLPIS